MANLEVNVTGTIDMTPAQKMNIPVVVTVPANCTVDVLLDVQLPVNDSAVMTVSHIEMVEVWHINEYDMSNHSIVMT